MMVKIVQQQLDAYNAKDIEALLATYAPDAEQYTSCWPKAMRRYARGF